VLRIYRTADVTFRSLRPCVPRTLLMSLGVLAPLVLAVRDAIRTWIANGAADDCP